MPKDVAEEDVSTEVGGREEEEEEDMPAGSSSDGIFSRKFLSLSFVEAKIRLVRFLKSSAEGNDDEEEVTAGGVEGKGSGAG